MDFPADITLRKTRMKFELTFKVVLLFSYQGFAFMRKLLYSITSTFVCQELFSSFFNFFFEAILFSSSIFLGEVVLLCRATFISYHTCFILSRTFFHLSEDFLSDFFQSNVFSCATYIILSQQHNYVKHF